jgi:hypothetical protein
MVGMVVVSYSAEKLIVVIEVFVRAWFGEIVLSSCGLEKFKSLEFSDIGDLVPGMSLLNTVTPAISCIDTEEVYYKQEIVTRVALYGEIEVIVVGQGGRGDRISMKSLGRRGRL